MKRKPARKFYSKELSEAFRILGKRSKRKRNTPWEHIEQCALMDWVKQHEKYDSSLALLHATFNPGKLSWHMANKLKREGAKAGFPDLFLPVPAYNSDLIERYGLFIEMKSKTGTMTTKQKRIFPLLREKGYQVDVCRSWQEAVKVLVNYLSLDPEFIEHEK